MSDGFHVVDRAAIDQLASEAAASPRRRAHLLLHTDHADLVQRLLIALQPGTYVRPHHHSVQWEMLVLLQGGAEVLSFSEDGRLLARIRMNAAARITQIPVGAWHGFVVLKPNTVVMEIKPGPYRANEFAAWAPAERDDNVPNYLEWLSA